MSQLPEHSPFGGSGAHRWMRCPASATLSQGIEDPESDYAVEGTTAHAVAAWCLAFGKDAWELIKRGDKPGEGFTLPDGDELFPTKEMADAVQVYLDAVRSRYECVTEQNVEVGFHAPSLHEMYYGRLDLIVSPKPKTLDIWDYKHGAGIVVEVPWNPQLMYYACGYLEANDLWEDYDYVRLFVAQPRGFHPDGPIREWGVTVEDLCDWLEGELLPAMRRVETDPEQTESGEHCRFCPVRYRACPQLLADAEEADKMAKEIQEKGAAHLTNEQVGRFLDLNEVLKIAAKAARETGFARAEGGAKIPGWKLAKARANRAWKEGAEARAEVTFGPAALTKPTVKSPAQIDALPEGKGFTARWAHKPDAGLQLVKDTDSRAEVSPSTKSMFKPQK